MGSRHLRELWWVTLLLFSATLVVVSVAGAQVPTTMSYQGILTDASGTIVADGNYSLSFKLYDAATGGVALWSEQQSVATTKGVFSVILGKVNALALSFNKTYWLGMTVGGELEMTPRVQLTSAAYSMRSVKADTANWVKVDFGTAGSLACGTPLGAGPGWIFYAPNGSRRDIRADNGGVEIDYKLYINADGNVGVGTGSWTGGKLGVLGDIFVTGNLTKEYTVGTRNNATPVAFGTINSDGTVATATPNVSSAWNATSSLYEITIAGVNYAVGDYVTTASALSVGTAAISAGSNKLYVLVRNSAGTLSQIGFSFVTYKP